jgi:hypothetical protein
MYGNQKDGSTSGSQTAALVTGLIVLAALLIYLVNRVL